MPGISKNTCPSCGSRDTEPAYAEGFRRCLTCKGGFDTEDGSSLPRCGPCGAPLILTGDGFVVDLDGGSQCEESGSEQHEESTLITTGPFVFRSEQENGDNVDCRMCGTRIDDDRHEVVTNLDGYAFCSPKCLLDDHDEGETLHPFRGLGATCRECGDTEEGLMHEGAERNIEPLLYVG